MIDDLLSKLRRESAHLEFDWAEIEDGAGFVLPQDYKDLMHAFGPGVLSEYLVLWAPEVIVKVVRRRSERTDALLSPNRAFRPDRLGGLVPWASSDAGPMFYWRAGSSDSSTWDIAVHLDDDDEWIYRELSTIDFLDRLLFDTEFGIELQGFPVVRGELPPSFEAV
ncbi:hypothetical protein ACFVDI_21120 [Nocardioides sp. NPDC057767]|uniref:hypothetical protein n=1 Tax=unclassified Nocardioides TaxID=2615069 RepID=UPI00366ABFDF